MENKKNNQTEIIPKKPLKNKVSVNLWDKTDFYDWNYCGMSLQWMSPDSPKNYWKKFVDKNFSKHNTYGIDDIIYHYNSRGFRRSDMKPFDFEDCDHHYPCILVSGCSLTEGIGLPEHHIWHSFLVEKLKKQIKTPIAKFNLGKGEKSTDTVVRYVYSVIQNSEILPDLVLLLLPPVHRREVIIIDERNSFKIWHFMPNISESAPKFYKNLHDKKMENLNYLGCYHNVFKNLLLLKWFLESKKIPWYFCFWADDFSELNIRDAINQYNNECTDFSIPKELSGHYIPDPNLLQNQIPDVFSQTIARDFSHPGPNYHYKLSEKIYHTLMAKPEFTALLKQWEKHEG